MSVHGRRAAMVWGGKDLPYEEFVREVRRWSAELEERGVARGQRIAVLGDYSPALCSLLVALVAKGNVAIPLTPAVGPDLDERLRVAQAHATVRFVGDRFAGFERREPGPGPEHEPFGRLRARDAAGLVLFSSGSTGACKAALLDLDRLLGKFRTPRTSYRTMAFLLIDHIGGINTLFSILSQGGTIVPLPARDPEAVCRAVETYRIELLPTTPTFLNMLLISEAHKRHDCSSLRLITYGTEPMPPSTLAQLHQELPGVELKQTYGLSELGILRTKSRESGSLWVRVGGEGYETKVVDGVLWIRSDSAMLGYLNQPSPFDADGWFNTGDSVEVDGEWLRILGRKSEIVNVGGEKVYPVEVESVLLEVENVRDASVTGRANPIAGQVVVARVCRREPEDPDVLRKRIRAHCRRRLAPYKVPVVIEVSDGDMHGDRFKKMRSRE